MQGKGNYSIQVGQDPHAHRPAFQQNPATAPPPPPPTSHYGTLAPQPQFIQHGHPSFHPRPGAVAYQHALTSFPHQGRPAPDPVASVGMSSAQSYLHHPRPPQISHSYPIIEQQPLPWSQNVHQLPPPAPLQGQSAYQLPSSHHTLERGLSHQHPSHAPPPPPPPHSSSSTVLMSGSGGSSGIPVQEHSYRQSIAPVLTLPPPPPPPPPPPLPPSPPRVPPLPPSSDIFSKKDGNLSGKGLPDGDNLALEFPPPGKPADNTSVGSVVVEAAHSLTDSDMDMDMEDDITYPDEEKNNIFSVNSNDECGSLSQDNYMGEKLQTLQNTGGHRLPEVSIHGNLLSAEASVAKAKGQGSEVASDCNFTVTVKAPSRDESGMAGYGQNRNSFDASVNESLFHHELFDQSGGPVVHPETGYLELSQQLMEGAHPFKILQGYSSSNTSENKDENLGDVSLSSINDVSTNPDAEKGLDFGSDLTKSPSESNKDLLPESLTVSPGNVMGSDKLAVPTGMVEQSSDGSHRGQEPDRSGTYIARQSKDSSRNYDKNIGLEEANAHKPDLRSDKLKVDEFGRLVREDVSDSDSSDSPSYVRRHARRARKRSRSQSRSRSPHNRRRRRRSPWRRKERRGRSRSLSPRRRSRSRSPVLRRDTEFGGDKLRREKGQLLECFDFLQGKCYRGPSCRYSHHESDKSERSRYNTSKQHHRDAPPTLRSPDIHKEGKIATEKEIKDKGRRLSQDMHGLREVKDEKELPVDSTSQSPDKIDNFSGYPIHETPSGKHDYLIPEIAAKYSDKIPQVVDQQGKRTDDSLLSESSSLAQAFGSSPIHHRADKQDPTSQLYSVESYSTKPYSNQEVPSKSLKELLPSIANHPSQLSAPLPKASQLVNASFAQPVLQDSSQKRPTPENYSTYEASVAYQHSHFPGPSKSLSSSLLPPPLPLPPPPTSVEHSTPQHLQQSLLPPWNGSSSYTSMRNQPTEMPNRFQAGEYLAYPFARERDQMLHRTDGFGSSSLHASNLTSREGVPGMMGEDNLAGDPVQGSISSKSFSQAQINPLPRHSPEGMYSSHGVGLSSDSNSAHGHSYLQQASYGLQYSAGGDVHTKIAEPGALSSSSASRITQDFLERNRPHMHGLVGSKGSNYFNPYASTFDLPLSSKFSSNTLIRENDATTTYVHTKIAEPGMLSSSASRITQDFLERNRPYMHGLVGSKFSNYFNPYASTFDLPLSSKFSSNTLVRENDATTTYGNPVDSSSVLVDPHRIGSIDSKNMISSSSALPAECVPRPGGSQYDPLFDSIEPTSNSFSKADHLKHEITGDSDDLLRFHGSGRLSNAEAMNQEEEVTVSSNDSLEKEEHGETADVAVGAVLNGSPSDPNDAIDMNAGEFEIDQVESSGKKKKKKSKERSMKHFKISIATFVKEVLKPSWRQGNMSKEAFKTIVKKTVDKVSGAMKGHQIPKSQSKINHYIDSSRGKLTKLVMGYVDKYVKV